MKVRNPFLLSVGRLLAMAAAVALGSAMAVAQLREALPDTAPSTPKRSNRDPDDPTTTRNQPSSERNPAQPRRTDTQTGTVERPSTEATKKAAEQPAVRTEDPTRGSTVRRSANARGEADVAGEPNHPRHSPTFGIQFGEQAQGALSIAKIEADTDAARAGLQVGDRIISVDGRNLTGQRQLLAYLSGQFGRVVPIVIERGGQRYTIQLTPSHTSNDGPWLGVYLQDNEENQTGARIIRVFPAGPAARAGLRTGDVIQQLNGKEVASTPDLIAMIDELDPRAQAQFVVLRGDQQVTIPVALGNRQNFVFYGDRNDQRNDNNSENNNNNDDEYSDIPPYAMQLEHDRRNAEQHQRIESELRKLQDEVRQLRELIEQRNK